MDATVKRLSSLYCDGVDTNAPSLEELTNNAGEPDLFTYPDTEGPEEDSDPKKIWIYGGAAAAVVLALGTTAYLMSRR